jgi:hypothetical protein
MFIFPIFSDLEVEIFDLLGDLTVLYFRAIPVKGSDLETTKSKAAFAFSNSYS